MKELKLFEKLRDAYANTTPKYNRFLEAILSINWDEISNADDEKYFVYGAMILTVQNLNPFEEKWKPSVIFDDGSYIEF